MVEPLERYPAWREAAEAFMKLWTSGKKAEGDLLEPSFFERYFRVELGDDGSTRTQKTHMEWVAQWKPFKTWLLKNHQIHLYGARDNFNKRIPYTYLIVKVEEQLSYAKATESARIKHALKDSGLHLFNIDITKLSVEQAKAVTDEQANLSKRVGFYYKRMGFADIAKLIAPPGEEEEEDDTE